MRNPFSFSVLPALCAAFALPAASAYAQVTTNTEILDTLQTQAQHSTPPSRHAPPARRTQKPAAAPAQATGGNSSSATGSAVPATPKPAVKTTIPDIPQAPPPDPQLTTPPNIELHPFPIPPQPVVQLKAAGKVTEIKNGIRVTFAPKSADLNPVTHQAILTFGQKLAENPYKQALINAYSSGATDDPSLPRRMAFSRGLAARSVLMNAGIPSTRIYLRVIGIPHDSEGNQAGTQDFIEISQSGNDPS